MRILRWLLSIVAILFSLMMCIITPYAFIGFIIVSFGLYQSSQKRKGKLTLSKPGLLTSLGIIFSLVIAIVLSEPVEETAQVKQNTEVASEKENQEKKAAEEAEKKAAEEAEKKAAAEAEKKAAAEAEKKAAAEAEKKAAEEAEKKAAAEAEKKAAEEAEKKAAEEAEKKAAEEAEKKAAAEAEKKTAESAPATTTVESYQNCTELRKAYPNGVGADHPAYESKHDRDKDNWACER